MAHESLLARLARRLPPRFGGLSLIGYGSRFALTGVTLVLAVAAATGQDRAGWGFVAWILCVAALLLLLGLHQGIKGRLDKVCESVESIGLGELSGRVDTILDGESGRIVDSVQQMHRDLVTVVEQVRGSSDRIGVAAQQVAAGSDNLSQRTEQQAATLEQIASSFEELASTVQRNSEHCQIASGLISESVALTQSGAGGMSRAMDSMSLVHDSSRRIGDISKMIEGIALQTNVLALNAAVEAARAGEQGRGFAVVAGEVRALAQRCSDAALDIKKLIATSVDNVSDSVVIVNDTGQVISRVCASVQQAAQLIGEIATGSREQSAGMQQVSQSVAHLEQVNLQNAALVEQTSAAARLFQREANALQGTVGHFKLDRAEGRHTAVELVRKGVAHLRAVGARQACDDFDDANGPFIFGEYYISAFDTHGIRVANGSDPASRGENIRDIRDADGKQHVHAIIGKAKARGKGWEDYKWTNPLTRQIEPKSVYFELIDDVIITCGIYRADASQRPSAPAETALGPLSGGVRSHATAHANQA
ncbi:MAG TPA: methyl-accepting chemotaxis protein [Burkholderiales bacterium]|nr:methyl-accepting chemotaxis protein [Burkholderiales bacterium]